MAEICLRHNIFMLVDEIHCDFVPPEHPHTTFGLLGEEVLRHSMVCYSSNKGFNLGGLGMATLVLADDDLRCKFNEEMSIAQTRLDNIFGMAALIAAYNDGEEWLDQAIAYVSDNKAYLDQFLRERIPQIRMILRGYVSGLAGLLPAALPGHGAGAFHDQRSQGGVLRRL